MYLEEAGESQYWEWRQDGLEDSRNHTLLEQREERTGFLIVCTYIFMVLLEIFPFNALPKMIIGAPEEGNNSSKCLPDV